MPAAEPLDGADVVLAFPHYSLAGQGLVFLISRRPAMMLTPEEAKVWASIGEGLTVDRLRQRHGPAVDETIARFVGQRVCETAPSRWPDGRRRILVIEPHSDDAALSVGATMWLRRHEVEFTLLTIASVSNFTTYWHLRRDYFDVDRVTRLRNAEGALFMRCLGGRHHALGLPEASLRYQDGDWTLPWFEQHEQSIYVSNIHRASREAARHTASRLRGFLEGHRFDEIWFPMGVGPHSDHELTRNACLDLLAREPGIFAGAQLRLFQDVPYDGNHPAHAAQLSSALRAAGAELSSEALDVEAGFDMKIRLLDIYASQFKTRVLAPDVGRSAGGPPRAEHFWRITRRPGPADAAAMHVCAEEAAEIAAAMPRAGAPLWRARSVAVAMLLPAGQWESDMQWLLRACPEARIHVYMSAVGSAECRRFDSERIHVTLVERGAGSWLRVLAGIAVRCLRPTILVVGPRHLARARRLARWWPLRRLVPASTFDVFRLACEGLAGPSGRSLERQDLPA